MTETACPDTRCMLSEERIDLHAHTTRSDGTLTPSELVSLALEKGLKALAVTDHDNVSGIREAQEAAWDTGLEIVPGIEFSTEYAGLDLHIVGLQIDPDSRDLIRASEETIKARHFRNREMCRKLYEYGILVTAEDLAAEAGENRGVITRAHFGRFLLHHGYVSSIPEAFDRYIGLDAPCYVPWKRMKPEDAVRLILKAGGIPVLAHPLKYGFSDRELRELLQILKNAGLEGIEIYYPTHSEEDCRYLQKIAAEFGLLPGGGSDFHGANKPDLELGSGRGNLSIPLSVLQNLKRHHFGIKPDTRIFFCDFDGTIARSDHTVSPAVRDVVRRFVEAGNIFVLCSGRPLANLKLLKKTWFPDIPAFLSGTNGAQIFDASSGRMLSYRSFPRELAREIIRKADELGFYTQTYLSDGIAVRERTAITDTYLSWVDVPVRIMKEGYPDDLPEDPVKIASLTEGDRDEMLVIRSMVEEEFQGILACQFSGPHQLEFQPAGVNKGLSVRIICRYLGLPVENAIAAGDDENDLAMLREAGTGIAMINGLAKTPALKDAAAIVTEEDFDHDGLVPVLEKLLDQGSL